MLRVKLLFYKPSHSFIALPNLLYMLLSHLLYYLTTTVNLVVTKKALKAAKTAFNRVEIG